jgi:hypothetical protein
MMRALWSRTPRLPLAGLAVAVTLLAACPACSSSSAHPSLIASNGGANDGHSGGGAGLGEGGEGENAGTGGDSGADGLAEGGTSSAGSSGEGGAGGPFKPGPSLCAERVSWSSPTTVDGVSADTAVTLLSITADELDLAFLRAGTLYVAHRSTESDAFSAGPAITIPTGWSAKQGAALSSDGKRLLLVSDPDQRKLGELTRATRKEPFVGEVDESAFALANQNAVYTGRIYASPVVSEQDTRLVFNSAYPQGTSTVVVSTRSSPDAPWSAPTTLTASLLDGMPGQRRLPTGMSADLRTLFYFNEATSKEEARWSASSAIGSTLYDMLSLGTRRGATPNSACDRLYSEADGDVVVEKD